MTVRLQPRPIGDTWRFFLREMSGTDGVDLSVYSDISCQIRTAGTRTLFATPTIILADQTDVDTRGSYELRVDAATTKGATKGLYVFDVQLTDSLGTVTTRHIPPLEFEVRDDVTKVDADPPVAPTPTFAGDGTRLLMRTPLGVYTSIRVEPAGTAAPTIDDDASQGYAAGSWWLYDGDMNPATAAFFVCIDATAGAAVWVRMPLASDANPSEAGTASPGTSAEYARADHVHPQAVSHPLLSPYVGHFSRATEAFRVHDCEWAAPDEPRVMQWGTLIERTPTYPAGPVNRGFSSGWIAGTGTTALGAADGPDGEPLTAAHVVNAAGQFGHYASLGAGPNACSFFARHASVQRHHSYIGVGSTPGVDCSTLNEYSPARWTLYSVTSPVTVGDTYVPVDSRAIGGLSAVAQDCYIDLLTIESGARYPTSPTRTQERGCDAWIWDAEEVPLALRASRSSWRIALTYSSSQLVSGDVRTLASFGGSSDALRIRHTGADVRIEAVTGGTVRASSVALAWTGTRTIPGPLAVIVDPVAGTVTVDGVTGTTGAAWAWPTLPLRIGGTWGGADELDGYVSIPEAA